MSLFPPVRAMVRPPVGPPRWAPIIRAPAGTCRGLRACAAALALVALAGCSNSKIVVGALYDRADDRARDAAAEWVTLDAEQQAAFDAYVGTFHTWHRRSEMPRYAALLGEMSGVLSEYGAASTEDWTRWFHELDARVQAVRACHPARFATATIRTLTPDQVVSIETHRAKLVAEWDADDADDGDGTRAERIARRVKNVDKWSGRLGLDLNRRQLESITAALERQTPLNAEYRALSDAWWSELFVLVRDPDALDYAARLDAHVSDWFSMLERAHPDAWRRNRALWRDFAVDFEKTLTGLQRRNVTRWMAKLGNTLQAVSRDRPDWLPADDPAYGCIVTGAGGNAADG